MFGVPRVPWFQRARLRRRLSHARRSGLGLFVQEWHFGHESLEEAAETISSWLRETAGTCRRPWGIASFDLALATCDGQDVVRSTRLKQLHPSEFYAPGFAARLWAAVAPAHPGHWQASVALFSWGDAVYAAVE
jgi:hypothetical protein